MPTPPLTKQDLEHILNTKAWKTKVQHKNSEVRGEIRAFVQGKWTVEWNNITKTGGSFSTQEALSDLLLVKDE